jgi:hypothetical protein
MYSLAKLKPLWAMFIEENDVEGLERCAERKGFVVNEKRYNGWCQWTPLGYAIEHDNIRIASVLLEKGADVEATFRGFGWSPLGYAIEKGSVDMVRLLLVYLADHEKVFRANADYVTPLQYARVKGNAEVIKALEAIPPKVPTGAPVRKNSTQDLRFGPIVIPTVSKVADPAETLTGHLKTPTGPVPTTPKDPLKTPAAPLKTPTRPVPTAPKVADPLPKSFPTIEGFRLDELLGRGGQASAYAGLEIATGRAVVIKIMTRADEETARLHENEVKALTEMRHDNVLQVISWRTRPSLCIISEFAERGDLRMMLVGRGCLSWEKEGRKMVKSIAEGVAYIHRKRIIHRDLKSENIFLDCNWEPKIGDFGLVKKIRASDPEVVGASLITAYGSGVGTPMYMAPEVMDGQFHQTASDVWAFGLIVREILCGQVPFAELLGRSENPAILMARIRSILEKHAESTKWALLPNDEDDWPREAIVLIQNCTQYKYGDRWTMEKVINHLK